MQVRSCANWLQRDRTVLVKICGLLEPEDAAAAGAAGADMLGIVFAPAWRRRTVAQARRIFAAAPSGLERVGVFVDAPLSEVEEIATACELSRVQLGGNESPAYCAALGERAVKTLRLPRDEPRVEEFDVPLLHLETLDNRQAGGTGKSWNYALARPVTCSRAVLLAGGLTAANVTEAIRTARPLGVDVSSGVENNRAKDPDKITKFVAQARAAFASLEEAA